LGVATLSRPLTRVTPLEGLVTHRPRFPYAAWPAICAADGASKCIVVPPE